VVVLWKGKASEPVIVLVAAALGLVLFPLVGR
jgi:hypothetical protein